MEALFGVWQLMLFGRVMTDGRLSARLKCDLTENLTLKGNAQVGDTMSIHLLRCHTFT